MFNISTETFSVADLQARKAIALYDGAGYDMLTKSTMTKSGISIEEASQHLPSYIPTLDIRPVMFPTPFQGPRGSKIVYDFSGSARYFIVYF